MKAQFTQLLQKVTHFSQNCNFLLIPPDQSHAGEIALLTRISVHKSAGFLRWSRERRHCPSFITRHRSRNGVRWRCLIALKNKALNKTCSAAGQAIRLTSWKLPWAWSGATFCPAWLSQDEHFVLKLECFVKCACSVLVGSCLYNPRVGCGLLVQP